VPYNAAILVNQGADGAVIAAPDTKLTFARGNHTQITFVDAEGHLHFTAPGKTGFADSSITVQVDTQNHMTGRTFQFGEGWHSNENAVRFWTPSPRVPKEADTRCYAYTTAYAMMIHLCNVCCARSKTPPPSAH
jgi:hypothetical protein